MPTALILPLVLVAVVGATLCGLALITVAADALGQRRYGLAAGCLAGLAADLGGLLFALLIPYA